MDSKIKQLKKEVSRTKGLLNKKLIPLEQYESLVFELEQLETQKNKFLSSQLATLYQEISDLEDNLQKTKIQKTEIAVKIKQEEISNEKFISKVLKEKNQSFKNYLVNEAPYPKNLLNLHVKSKMLSYFSCIGNCA